MSIQILPAQLANQIAAGEVVERPASVIKELVENSLDAGATSVKIQIEKGGAKRIKITDNGIGIAKDELTLALSRHATSKIKTLNDLESISSLGFRGEALASISSVSRLTLTSKPQHQDAAWQAMAEGRDMTVEVKPAAHPNGTSIDVQDLFFNTPARRKFLRTDKTEFTHIEEVVKRIALARLDVTFILIHNDKIVRQYRAANNKGQYGKRVAQICGQKFIDNALEIECNHNDLQLSGWLAKPSFARNQNDLCYSYVNGRMMKDKLINHAIRQAYEDLLPPDTYPAFVLFLTLNFRDVDVNVHPAKHEVRFQQGRYIHDFILSVCRKALFSELESRELNIEALPEQYSQQPIETGNVDYTASKTVQKSQPDYNESNVQYSNSNERASTNQGYIKPLTQVSEQAYSPYQGSKQGHFSSKQVSTQGVNAYQQLMTNDHDTDIVLNTEESSHFELNEEITLLHVLPPEFAVIRLETDLRLLSLSKLQSSMQLPELKSKWETGFISQPLLLPINIELAESQVKFIVAQQLFLERLGIFVNVVNNKKIQIRQFPATLRNKDVVSSFTHLIDDVSQLSVIEGDLTSEAYWLASFSDLLKSDSYTNEDTINLLNKLKKLPSNEIQPILLLNSVKIDLTSEISKLI